MFNVFKFEKHVDLQDKVEAHRQKSLSIQIKQKCKSFFSHEFNFQPLANLLAFTPNRDCAR